MIRGNNLIDGIHGPFVTVFGKQSSMQYLSSKEMMPTFLPPMKEEAMLQY